MRDAYLVLPRYQSGGGADEMLYFDLGSGNGYHADSLRREPERIRVERVDQNLFDLIGRPRDQPARVGEIFLHPLYAPNGSVRSALFVESSTGYVAYFEEIGRRGTLDTMKTLISRPFESLATEDGNYALLGRRSSSGETIGAYLYHATTGRASYVGALDELDIDPPTTSIDGLPAFDGRVAAAPVLDDEETIAYAVVDGGSGRFFYLDLERGRTSALRERTTELDLVAAFASDDELQPTARRFVLAPIVDADATTQAILVVDAATGGLGLIEELEAARPFLRVLPRNLYDVLRDGSSTEPRALSIVVGGAANGATDGLWLLDNLTGGIVYLSNPTEPSDLRLLRVNVERQ
ncbi:MAG: hypothetical protein AAGC60_30230 [Acidobacteriota bacterium]